MISRMLSLPATRIWLGLSWWLYFVYPGVVAAEIRVLDDFNREIVLAAPASRTVSLAPHVTENLFSAGAGEKIVGVVEFSNYPPAAEKIASVGSYVQFNLETILTLEPDLVVAWRSGNNSDALDRIEKLGLPIYYSEPRTFEDIIENIEELTILAGTRETMDPMVSTVAQTIETARQTYANRQSIAVFYQVWPNPLMTLNGDHFLTRVLELCGARNLFADLPVIAPRVNIEAVIEANPEIIITGKVDGVNPDMSIWDKWQIVDAVRNQHIIFINSDVMHRHTLRMLREIPVFCDQIDKVRQALLR